MVLGHAHLTVFCARSTLNLHVNHGFSEDEGVRALCVLFAALSGLLVRAVPALGVAARPPPPGEPGEPGVAEEPGGGLVSI
mmetsp:Transcript_12376/g.29074  ORF Transcript_12376/g.29074 Transcript_12376/m.29074 type:complete len:81 (-) Transcript_12376:238-480(-)